MSDEWRLRVVEFVVWVLAATGIVVGASLLVGVAIGGVLAGKYAVFLSGVALFGIGSLAIQPGSLRSGEERVSLDGDGELSFEEYIQRVPPLRDRGLRLDRRVDRSIKVFVTGLLVLGVSGVMEFVFGVTV